jgi:glycosyltransferase involved in cell wall biosynthesis
MQPAQKPESSDQQSEFPFVTIGLPVYNGENYVALAIESLLAQDYPNFELLISDNNSKDRTEQICREFAEKDARVRYVRQPINLGMPGNFAWVVQNARGEYFTAASHDDLFAPAYVRRCMDELRAHPSAVFCCTEINFIDADGNPHPLWANANYKNIGTLGMTPVRRIHELLIRMGWFATFGLMRVEDARRMSLGLNVYGYDVILMAELMYIGDFAKIDEPLFSYRIAREKTTEDYRSDYSSETEALPAMRVPKTGLAVNLLQSVYQSQLSAGEKLEVFADFIVTLTYSNRAWRNYITAELLGPEAAPGDSEFALLLAAMLSRSLPLDAMQNNPLITAISRVPTDGAALLKVADDICRNQALKTMSGAEAHQEGTRLFGEDKFQEASGYFALALQREESSERWQDWATARLACGELAEAANGFGCAVELDGSNREAALKLGLVLVDLDRSADAVPFLARGVTLTHEPLRSQVLQLLSECREAAATAAAQ